LTGSRWRALRTATISLTQLLNTPDLCAGESSSRGTTAKNGQRNNMTPEAKVKAKVIKILRATPGLYYFFPVTGGFGRSGVPDIVVCYCGIFVGIECKAGGNKPTPLQDMEMTKIREAGGLTLIVNETNVDAVEALLVKIRE